MTEFGIEQRNENNEVAGKQQNNIRNLILLYFNTGDSRGGGKQQRCPG